MRTIMLAILLAGASFAGIARAAGDAAAGKDKSIACAMCHGAAGEGTQMAPRLAGMDPATFSHAIDDFKSGKRDNAMMKAQAGMLSADDIANLAAYYASLK